MKSKTQRTKGNPKHPFPAGPAMRRAAKRAREIARRFGTPIYYIKDGRIVAEKP